jgi:transitional endoplasmic reticulum ATPase
MSKEALATAILTKKHTPNTLLVDDATAEDHSTITLNAEKMEELGLLSGETVLLKGKKSKKTVAVVISDDGVSINRVRMTKVVRSNLR